MAEVRIEDIEKALADSTAGCRELDIFVYMVMHPEITYHYDSGTYYQKSISKRNNLLEIAPMFTTSWDVSRTLIHENWNYSFFIRKNDCFLQLRTLRNDYQCRAADFPLGLCCTIMKISRIEGYDLFSYADAEKKEASVFFSEKEVLKKLIANRQKLERRAATKDDLVSRYKRLRL